MHILFFKEGFNLYSRQAAVQYANKWWDSYNPEFPIFDVDCTNYVSQCLLAGGAPMWGYPNREKGWWVQGGDLEFKLEYISFPTVVLGLFKQRITSEESFNSK